MRLRIFYWLARNAPEGCLLPKWLLAVRTVMFPLDMLRYWLGLSHGFDPLTMTWTIHGIRYSDALFRLWGRFDGPDQQLLYRFKRNDYGALDVEAVKPKL